MLIELGTKQDINTWMSLVEKVKDAFPGLEIKEALNEHKNTVLDFMGRAARAFYKRIGFTEGKLTEEFGSPVQEFVLKR